MRHELEDGVVEQPHPDGARHDPHHLQQTATDLLGQARDALSVLASGS